MTKKKENLIKILEQLEPLRNLAKWLKILVQEWTFWDQELDILINAIAWAIHTAKTEKDKKKLEKWMSLLEKIKEREKSEENEDIDLDLSLF